MVVDKGSDADKRFDDNDNHGTSVSTGIIDLTIDSLVG